MYRVKSSVFGSWVWQELHTCCNLMNTNVSIILLSLNFGLGNFVLSLKGVTTMDSRGCYKSALGRMRDSHSGILIL